MSRPIWRAVLITPAESQWIMQRGAADPTSGSLRADATSASLRGMEACGNELGGARSSCPMNRNGSCNVALRTRQAGPSERTRQAGPSEEFFGPVQQIPRKADSWMLAPRFEISSRTRPRPSSDHSCLRQGFSATMASLANGIGLSKERK
jgi:hypothetical protein